MQDKTSIDFVSAQQKPDNKKIYDENFRFKTCNRMLKIRCWNKVYLGKYLTD